jgi:hypothetical protein
VGTLPAANERVKAERNVRETISVRVADRRFDAEVGGQVPPKTSDL